MSEYLHNQKNYSVEEATHVVHTYLHGRALSGFLTRKDFKRAALVLAEDADARRVARRVRNLEEARQRLETAETNVRVRQTQLGDAQELARRRQAELSNMLSGRPSAHPSTDS